MFRVKNVTANINATNRPIFSNSIRVRSLSQTLPPFLNQRRNFVNSSQPTVLTNQIYLDSVFSSLNVTGNINISLQFEDFPTASFTLLANNLNIASVRQRFRNFNRKLVIYGIPFRVSSYNESIDPSPQNRYIVNVQLEGWNKYLCDKTVYVRVNKNKKTYTLSQVAAEAGVSCTNIQHKFASGDEVIITTTLKNIIDQVTSTYGLTANYTGQTISLTSHNNGQGFNIPNNKIINLTTNHNQNNVEGFLFPPTYLEWDDPQQRSITNETSQLRQKPVYQQIRNQPTTIVTDPEIAALPPSGYTTIKTLDINYDMSGPTKTREVVVKEGDKTIRKTVEIFGYAYTSRNMSYDAVTETYYMAGSSFWQLIEKNTTDYIYDTTYGYYLGSSSTGSKYIRYKQESELREVEKYMRDANNTDLDPNVRIASQDEASLYEFFWTPTREEERLQLRSFHSVYADDNPESEQVYEQYEVANTITGKIETKYTRNLTYVLPMFVEKRYLYKNNFASRYFRIVQTIETEKEDNGDGTGTTVAKTYVTADYMSTGEEKTEFTHIEISPSYNTYQGVNYLSGSSTTRLKDDAYTEYQKVTTSQDSGFKNSFTQITSNIVQGKPSQAEYYPLFESVTEQQNGDTMYTQKQPIKTVVKSSSWNDNVAPTSTQYFAVSTKAKALSALETQLTKQQLFGAKEFTFKTLFNSNVKPNYNVSINYNGESYVGRVKSINHDITLLEKGVAKGWTTITCGMKDTTNPVSLTTYKEVLSPEPNAFIPRPFTLGDIKEVDNLMQGLPNRGNF